MIQGLSKSEAEKRLKENGYNELVSSKPNNILRIALEVIKEPMFILMICCALLYMILGDYKEGAGLLTAITFIISITFYQYQKTEKALEALKALSSPTALVIRDGQNIRIPGREVVVDDIIILNEGDRIVADGILIDNSNITVDESLLTGESVPVSKNSNIKNNSLTYPINVFSGTLVVQGKGYAKVTSIGKDSQFGKIGTSLQSINEENTRLQIEMKSLIKTLFLISIIISSIVVIAFYFTRGNFILALLSGLTSAMSILPEEFIVVLTVFLALGSYRLSKKNVLTRRPSAIETLGSATVLCSDKTGTITQNKMQIVAIYDGEEIINQINFKNKKKTLIELLKSASDASIINSIDPMEKAIFSFQDSNYFQERENSKIIKEYPLSSDTLSMTIVIENKKDNKIIASTKGAPETIFTLCKMDQKEKDKNLEIVHQLAKNGFRVIGIANSILSDTNLPENQKDLKLDFLGLIGFEDPIRTEVPEAVNECNDAGIKVIMITGDFPETAKSIATKIGINHQDLIITGDELKKMSDEEFMQKIAKTSIFARVKPEQKLRIVEAFKKKNEIVAMTGDGVNDAPALKAAHIGIAMGLKGTDVAREASSLVLLDDNFASIVAAIRSGRRIFDNLQKAMSYIISIHIPIIGLSLIPAFISDTPILLMPLHIIFLELFIDPACSIAFEYQEEERGIMNRPPRNPNEKFFGGKKIALSMFKGLILLIMILIVYSIGYFEGHNEFQLRAITFSALIIGNIFLIISDLSKTKSFIYFIKERNIAAFVILTIAFFVLILVIKVPTLQRLFKFQDPGIKHFIPALLGGISILIIFETMKYLKMNKLNYTIKTK